MIENVPGFPKSYDQRVDTSDRPDIEQYQLHGHSVRLSEPLLTEGDIRPDDFEFLKFAHIDGDVVGVVVLPCVREDKPPDEQVKKIAIIDYGPDFESKRFNKDFPVLGGPSTRWGLRALDYFREDGPMAQSPIDGNLTIGSDDTYENEKLALGPHGLGVDGEKVTIEIAPDNTVVVSDSSVNPTGLVARIRKDGFLS